MKQCSNELKTFLASTEANELRIADLYTFTLTTGQILRYTSADFDITINENTYSCKNAGIARSEMGWQLGLSVDDVTIEMNPSKEDTISEIPLVEAFRNGTFDGAEIQLDMAFYTEGWSAEPLILEKLFVGNVDVDELSNAYVKLSIKSKTEILNTNFPPAVYQTGCCYTLYGAGCNVDKTNFSERSYILQGTTKKDIYCSLRKGNGYYQNGVIQFTNGANANIKKSIKLHSNGCLILSTPLPYTPAVGDSFIVYAGCDKTMATCKGKFKNFDNFSGTPFIPKADSSL